MGNPKVSALMTRVKVSKCRYVLQQIQCKWLVFKLMHIEVVIFDQEHYSCYTVTWYMTCLVSAYHRSCSRLLSVRYFLILWILPEQAKSVNTYNDWLVHQVTRVTRYFHGVKVSLGIVIKLLTYRVHGSKVFTACTKYHFVTKYLVLTFLLVIRCHYNFQVTHKVEIEQAFKDWFEKFNWFILNHHLISTLIF